MPLEMHLVDCFYRRIGIQILAYKPGTVTNDTHTCGEIKQKKEKENVAHHCCTSVPDNLDGGVQMMPSGQ